MPETALESPPDTRKLVQSLLKQVSAIATLPEVTTRIIGAVENPRSSASELHKIIAHDPALAARILKVVNSAFYGLPGQIGSVERAIVMLGLNAVKNLAVAASLGQMFRTARLCEGYTARDLWKHCIAVAVLSREIARRAGLPLLDEAFLSGLIHDLGLLVWMQADPGKLADACAMAAAGRDFCEGERDLTQIDHQMLGAALAETWKFPRSCQLVAGFHHRPLALASDNRLMVCIVHAADTIAARAGIGFDLTARNQSIDGAVLSAIALDDAGVKALGELLPALMESASSMLN